MLPLEGQKTAEAVIERALDVIGCPYEAEVSLLLTMDEQIQKMNTEFRGIERSTDVLSFPNLNKAAKQKLTDFEAEKVDGQLFLGDIVICKKRAKQQAKEYGHGKNREICFLALHGFLHLLGYDHIEKADEKLMQKTAEKILAKLGANR